MTTGYVVEQTSTRGLSASDSTALWREHVTLNQGALDFDFDREAAFWGSTVVQRAEGYQLIEYSSSTVSYTRTLRHARADDDRSLRLLLPVRGGIVVESEEATTRVGPGTAAVLSMTSSFALHHESGTHAWILSTPERSWPASLTTRTPLRFAVDGGVGAIAVGTLRGLSRQRSSLREPDFLQLSEQACELLITCAGRQAPVGSAVIESAARQLVAVRAPDHSLTPTTLAHELGWSLRHLQGALHQGGTTPAELIRSARLDRAWGYLHARERRAQTISEIAHASGFGSLSGFNAAFRERYSCSPRQVRREARDQPDPGPDPGPVPGSVPGPVPGPHP